MDVKRALITWNLNEKNQETEGNSMEVNLT